MMNIDLFPSITVAEKVVVSFKNLKVNVNLIGIL